MAERTDKYEPDITKIQKGVEEEAHNQELLKQRNRQLEHLGLEQHHRHMQAITEEPEKESIIGLPLGMTRKPDEEWHEEKRPARARTVEDMGPRMETNVTPSQGMTGAKHGLRGYFGNAVGGVEPEVPHGIRGLEELARLNLVDVEEPTESGMPRRAGAKSETAPVETERRDVGESKPTVTSGGESRSESMETGMPTAGQLPVPGTMLRQELGRMKKEGGMEKGEQKPSEKSVHRARPLVSNIEEKEPQFEPVPHLVQATRPLPEWKQGEKEEQEQGKLEKGGKKKDVERPMSGMKEGQKSGDKPKLEKTPGGKKTESEFSQKMEGKIAMEQPKFETGGKMKETDTTKDTDVGVRLGTGMGHGGVKEDIKSGKITGDKPKLETGKKEGGERPLTGAKEGKIAADRPKLESGVKKPDVDRPLTGMKEGKIAGDKPKLETGGKKEGGERPLSGKKEGKIAADRPKLETGKKEGGERPLTGMKEGKLASDKPKVETGGQMKDTGVGVRLGTGMGHGGIRPQEMTGETEGMQKKPMQQPKEQTRTTGPTYQSTSWQKQAEGQSSGWQGGVCPHTGKTKGVESKGTTGAELGKTRKTDESLWQQQAMGQSSEWQGGVCPHTGKTKGVESKGTTGTELGKTKGVVGHPELGKTADRPTTGGTDIPTTLERDVGEGRSGRMPTTTTTTQRAWPASILKAPRGVGVESMQAVAGLPGAPPEWQGEGSGKVESAEGDRKMVKEEMGMASVQSDQPQPELEGHREQELGGRTQLAQQ